MKDLLMRRKIFLELCENHDNINDDPFCWGSWKIFWGRSGSTEDCVKQFVLWREKTGKKNENK